MRPWHVLGRQAAHVPNNRAITTLIRPSTALLPRRTVTPFPVAAAAPPVAVAYPFKHIPRRPHGTHHHHDHGEGGHVHADLLTTLKTSSKRGMRITLIGLFANIGLTASKGIAGWLMNSASLLADATHSFSDLLSDFITLYTFKMSRKPPDPIYPYGYGKFETIGSLAVGGFLLAGGVGIGFHSFELLVAAINPATVPEVATQSVVAGHHHHHHHHGSDGVLDPNAAWFALASVVVKEWLYRATIKVGKEERSEVLIANAWHHRSDAYSSVVALIAIVGSYAGIPVLDPIGGLIVSAMILKQGNEILVSSLRELMDKGISRTDVEAIARVVSQIKEKEGDLVGFHSVRGRKQGPFQHVDLVLQVNPELPMHKAHRIEHVVQDTVKQNFPEIQQVLVYLETPHSNNHNTTTITNHQHPH